MSGPLEQYARSRVDESLRGLATYLPLTKPAKPTEEFSLKRLLPAMMTERGLADGFEREICTEAARALDREFDPHRIIIPWRVLAQRDLTSTNSGTYLIDTANVGVADALKPWSVSVRAGCTLLTNLKSNVTVPRIDGDLTGGWLASDGVSAITPSQPTLGQVSLSPKTWGGIVQFSHQFARQFDAEPFLRAQLLRTAGRALDAAILNASGNTGQPLGLINSGLPSTSGATFSLATAAAMRKTVAAAGADDAMATFVASPATREVLAQRDRGTDTGIMVWANDRIDNRAAYATPDCPDGVLIHGDFSKVAVGLWGPGFEFQVNPYADFSRGLLQARVLLMCDVAIMQTDALMLATSVS